MNGRPVETITDILIHKRGAFSPEMDSLIAQIIGLGGERKLERYFNLLPPPPFPEFERSLKEMHELLLKDAKERGWDVGSKRS
jgi:hypothetical protein